MMRTVGPIALLLPVVAVMLGVSLSRGEPSKPAVAPAAAELLSDGSFEAPVGPKSPWYSLEQGEVVAAADAPHGKRVIRFQNKIPGRASQVKQHIRLDGRTTPAIEVAARVKLDNAGPGLSLAERPSVNIQLFDEHFVSVGGEIVGPWSGTIPWTLEQARLIVPPRTRVALITIGLAGGTGNAKFDQIEIKPGEVNPSALPRKPGDE
ncbi:MAG TPA: hypothetical protein VGJ26_16410 [Pirellulales bacterium]|jgi:hypothetical protein